MQTMTDEEFKLLTDFTTQQCGITYAERQKYLFQQKLLKRLEANGLKNYKDYYYLLKYNSTPTELSELFNVLTVNETYFMREKEHILVVKDYIAKDIFSNKKTLKILSAGCSTGEEAYSLSITLNELEPNYKNKFTILGLDISKRAVDIANSATYRKISLTFRAVNSDFVKAHFYESPDTYTLKESIRENVSFKCTNLFDAKTFSVLDKFDIIFCRNVMIYFDKTYKQNLINTFYNLLNPNGYLILSNTENLNDVKSKFKHIKLNGVFLYQK